MKFIKIPADQPIFNLAGDRVSDETGADAVATFRAFVLGRLADPKFGRSMVDVLAAFEIKCKLEESSDGILALEGEHYKLLLDVTEHPSQSHQYNTAFSHNLTPFMKAIKDAVDKRPEEPS